jgi:glycosyltransferase involved in cell wall biosynthesis
MKILLLTFYYEPDLCAGSFRAQALVNALRRQSSGNAHIDVVTTMPNRYHSYVQEAQQLEEQDGVTIHRVQLPSHKSGMADQSRAFLTYGYEALKLTRRRKWDVVVATSSRLMTAALGARVAQRGRMPLYLDIRDLFTDTMGDLLQGRRLRHILPLFAWLEKWSFQQADRLNLVSAGFLPHMRSVVPGREFSLFTNGIDDAFLEADFTASAQADDRLPLILYAGNMGDGQGLHRIIPDAARKLEGRVRFRLIGTGGRRVELERAIENGGIENVELLDPVPRARLLDHYRGADAFFLHLNDYPAFRRVLPSKIFEYAATGKPLVAGVTGQAAEFLEREVPGSFIFSPCDANAMVRQVGKALAHGPEDRNTFRARFSREAIMNSMAVDVLGLAGMNKSWIATHG